MNIANQHSPKLFSEYIGQTGVVKYITAIIKSNKHPSGILISGNPGVGKSRLAHLYVKATLCENRLEGEYEPCNNCSSCLSDIEKGQHPNITYYRITEASIFKDAVNDLISMTKASPVITHDNNRADNQHRFIIIDEVQSASKQSISPFLDSLEFAVENVTVILISMDLNRMDSIVREAIESRCIELSLDKLNAENISSKLQEIYNELHPDSADLIAYLCKGNMRKAWRYIEFFSAQENLSLLTSDTISKQFLCGINKITCQDIINSIETNTWENTLTILKSISSNEEQIIDYFINVLIDYNLNVNGIVFLSSLSFWLQSDFKIPILSLFKQVQGKQLTGDLKAIQTLTRNEPVYTVPKVYASSKEINNATLNIASELARISGKELHVNNGIIKQPTYLQFKSWSLFLEAYDNN